jgi:hypothetical protein
MGDFRYLLDTNIVSELVKNPQGRLSEKMLASGWEKYSCTRGSKPKPRKFWKFNYNNVLWNNDAVDRN